MFQQKELLYTLNNIHKEFVASPEDKAIGNVIFDCQGSFALVPIKNLV